MCFPASISRGLNVPTTTPRGWSCPLDGRGLTTLRSPNCPSQRTDHTSDQSEGGGGVSFLPPPKWPRPPLACHGGIIRAT
ncbi:hypothetical protein E2C01_059512 [Portunus trituberculatus]|uniref:Uncharacterized protein n=1 Tax=Portunus trituberculatus TaxID=210409 RepID=A0A5B7H8L2_PORTR|nr:hypothetical protein [Portunus trituberculatus]